MIEHIKGTRKGAYLLSGIFMLIPFGYGITNLIAGSFVLTTFLWLLLQMVGSSVAICFLIMANDYHKTEKLKKRFVKLDLKKIGDGNFQVNDWYTGWSRKIEVPGTFRDEPIALGYRHEPGTNFLYLNLYTGPSRYEYETQVKFDEKLTAEDINKMLDDLLTRK